MNIRQVILLLFVVLPGFGASAVSAYYLLPEWTALENSHQNFQRVAQSPASDERDLLIAQAAENRHRINCFAEGVGVLLGGGIAAIGIHGLCTLPKRGF
ncbi:MAG: hypothetical protein LDL41_14190 [Coleofasciculus sp. S288]|nr:hypothetical protein [Coleofasciculus sp. S288]